MVDNGLTLLGSSPSNARSEGGIATNRQDSRPNFRRVADDAGVEGNRSTQRRQRVLWRTEVVCERQGDVRLGRNTDNALKGLGVAGQSSEVAARHKKIDSYACPPVLERPQQSATHFANRHTGKTVAEGFPADVLEFATCTQAQGQAVAMPYLPRPQSAAEPRERAYR